MPPDHKIGEPDPAVDVARWGIDVFAESNLNDVLEVRDQRRGQFRGFLAELSDGDLSSLCAHNPVPGFPPTTRIPVQVAIDVVIGEEWAHHGFANRDLTELAARHSRPATVEEASGARPGDGTGLKSTSTG